MGAKQAQAYSQVGSSAGKLSFWTIPADRQVKMKPVLSMKMSMVIYGRILIMAFSRITILKACVSTELYVERCYQNDVRSVSTGFIT